MGNPTNQQRIEHLEMEFKELSQKVSTQIHAEIGQLEENLTLNQSLLETKYTNLDKTTATIGKPAEDAGFHPATDEWKRQGANTTQYLGKPPSTIYSSKGNTIT